MREKAIEERGVAKKIAGRVKTEGGVRTRWVPSLSRITDFSRPSSNYVEYTGRNFVNAEKGYM